MKKKASFTLVELLIGISIFTVAVVSIYSSLRSGFFGYSNIEQNIEVYQSARAALQQLNRDLRNSFSYSAGQVNFSGDKESLSFFTIVDSYQQERMEEEYAYVSYFLEEERLLRLCRKNKEALKEDSLVEPQELLSGAKITFAYAQGYAGEELSFKDSWGVADNPPEEEACFPLAVKVTLQIKKGKIEKGFERTVFFPLL